jgi:hypothetical protein
MLSPASTWAVAGNRPKPEQCRVQQVALANVFEEPKYEDRNGRAEGRRRLWKPKAASG